MSEEFADPLVSTIVAFLRGIGLEIRDGTITGQAALPGIDIDRGALVVDPQRLAHPGDLLHEAGHLAVATPARREQFHHDVGKDAGEEMAAIAWSYAAALHLKIDPAIVFHADGYRGGSASILANFACGHYFGVPMLAYAGMAVEKPRDGTPAYPHMQCWLRTRGDIMSEHHAAVRWTRASSDFTYDGYNRAHDVTFKDGRIVVPGSASPAFRGDADRVDPEEAFVAALSACHMLSFLAICARKRLTVDSYEDDAVGYMEKGENGKLWVARVELRPRVGFAPGTSVDAAMLAEIHHRSHEECFIANSVKTDVSVTPQS